MAPDPSEPASRFNVLGARNRSIAKIKQYGRPAPSRYLVGNDDSINASRINAANAIVGGTSDSCGIPQENPFEF